MLKHMWYDRVGKIVSEVLDMWEIYVLSKSHKSNKKYGTREESVIQLCITKKGPWLMGGKLKIISNFLHTEVFIEISSTIITLHVKYGYKKILK